MPTSQKPRTRSYVSVAAPARNPPRVPGTVAKAGVQSGLAVVSRGKAQQGEGPIADAALWVAKQLGPILLKEIGTPVASAIGSAIGRKITRKTGGSSRRMGVRGGSAKLSGMGVRGGSAKLSGMGQKK